MNPFYFSFEGIEGFSFPEDILKLHINEIIDDASKEAEEINVVFCSDQYLYEMNKKYLDHDYFTDIITFDYCHDNFVAGDLYISVDRLKENAIKYYVSFVYELARVVFHGVLHLVGYNDSNGKERMIMKRMENYYLKRSGLKALN